MCEHINIPCTQTRGPTTQGGVPDADGLDSADAHGWYSAGPYPTSYFKSHKHMQKRREEIFTTKSLGKSFVSSLSDKSNPEVEARASGHIWI